MNCSWLLVLITWLEITEPIGDALSSVFGSAELMGIFCFIIIMILTLVFGLGMVVGCVVLIPALFLVFEFIPAGRIIVAIILGFVVGIGLNKIIRR